MNRIEIANLIDLSIEDEDKQMPPSAQINASPNSRSNDDQSILECTLPDFLIVEKQEGRESLDNNPFDLAQKLSTRPADPFDIVEKEACVKARYSMQPQNEVKEGKLLSLSDDNILDNADTWHAKESATLEKSDTKYHSDINASHCSLSIYHSALVHELDSESPPISMSIKSTPDTCSSAIDTDSSANSADGYSAKIRKAIENRKRLLKLSIANSTFNSPLSCRSRQTDSGFSTVFSAAAQFSDYILATESPLKLVDDDLMTEGPPKLSDAENDFEADLEMLSIPMLRKLPSPVPEETSLLTKEAEDAMPVPQNVTPPDLSAIREKLRAKRMQACKGQDVVALIDNLKSLLCENEIVDDNKKEQANCLLKKLSSALNTDKIEDNNNDSQKKNSDDSEPSIQGPQTIVRQGTFDLELQLKASNGCDKNSVNSVSTGNNSQMTHSIQSTQSLSPTKDIPEVMLKSSGTYDGEPISERENLLLPHVESFSPITSPNLKPTMQNTAATNPDVNDIIEQIGKLLEQHQIATQASNIDTTKGNNSSGNNPLQQSAMCNPTFIVVMPTNSVQPTNGQDINNVNCNDVLDDMDSNIVPRRRAQSLSIHDKVKIVQLPLRSQVAPYITEEAPSPVIEGAPQINNTAVEMKTPIRSTLRRNSFSSGTPHTPLSSLNHGTANSRRLQSTSTIQSRYSLGPSKLQEHESQQQAVMHTITRSNLNVFKPDLKKRTKTQTTKTSVMASNGPLKAVIPIKKVAPMLTTTITTPEGPDVNSLLPPQTANMETSMNLLTTTGKLSHTSTPMPPTRCGEQLSGFPNACSTPAITSVAKRPNGTITKKNPRFSLSTPSKLQQPLANTSGIKKRALPELAKPKSPVRPRNSMSGISVPAVRGRQSLAKQQIVTKQTTSRLSTRLSTRSSICAGSASTNKENKKP
ncbi:uncharacterized protein LOC105218942 [Zeugodacus cucurbitae]|nr:uncharacterized protein LOC105218942 [Zeugodacus cucurbitae]